MSQGAGNPSEPGASRAGADWASDRWPPGWDVRRVPVTGSTNDDLAVAATTGAPHRSVLVADHQTAGRGRLDRRWEAPPGANLLVSLLLRDPGPNVHAVVQRLALGARAACHELAGVDAALKWPNDLLLGGRKLAGILAQRLGDGSVVAGLGLNVRWCPDGATRLGDAHDPLDVLAATLAAFDGFLPADVAHAYRLALATLGQRVAVDLGDRQLDGLALDVDDRGRLIVRDDDGRLHTVDAGDVVHLR